MVQMVQIEIYLRKKYCFFISTQHATREPGSPTTQEHGSTSRKPSFSLIHPVFEENT